MTTAARSEYELKKLADFWFDLSKITLVSLVLKLFEPGKVAFTIGSLLTVAIGLTFSSWSAKIALEFAKRVK